MSEVEIVRLVLPWHEDKKESVDKLHSVEGVYPHVHENTVQDRHGDELEDWSQLDRQTREEKDANSRHSLLPIDCI